MHQQGGKGPPEAVNFAEHIQREQAHERDEQNRERPRRPEPCSSGEIIMPPPLALSVEELGVLFEYVTRDEIREFLGISASGRDGVVLPGHVRSLQRRARRQAGWGQPRLAHATVPICARHSWPQFRCSGQRAQFLTRSSLFPRACMRTAYQGSSVTRAGALTAGQVTCREIRALRQVGHKAQAVGTKSTRIR